MFFKPEIRMLFMTENVNIIEVLTKHVQNIFLVSDATTGGVL